METQHTKLTCLRVCVCVHTHTLSHVWLCNPINCSLSSSSVCEIFQARNIGCYKSSDQNTTVIRYYKEVRQDGAWGLGPLLQCFHLDKHLEQQNTPSILYWCKLSEPKNNCLHAQLGQIMNNKTEKKKKQHNSCHFWRAGSRSSVLHTPSAHKSSVLHMPSAKHLRHPSRGTHSYPHPI